MNSHPNQRNRPGKSILATVMFGLLIAAVVLSLFGFVIYRTESQHVAREQAANLEAIAELKSLQIADWRKEMAFTAWRLSRSWFLGSTIDKLSDPAIANELREHLALQASPDGGYVLLFSPEGKLLLSSKNHIHEETAPLDPALRRAIDAALADKQAVASDLYRCPLGNVHIDFVASVPGSNGKPPAVLVLRKEADEFLFPVLKDWPLPSETAELVLAARDGDDVIFLSNPRHAPDAALNLRLPLDHPHLPPARWLRGDTGVSEGIDYRGKPVFTDIRPIPDSPWIIVAKIDKDEAFRELPGRIAGIGLATVLALTFAGLLAGILFIRHQGRINRSLQASEERFRSYVEGAPDGILVVDSNGYYTDANPAAERMSGFSRSELIGKHVTDLAYEGDRELGREHFALLVSTGRSHGEIRHVTKDGQVRYWLVNAIRAGGDRYIGFVSDIHDRHIAQQKVEIAGRRAEALLKLPAAMEKMAESEFMAYGQELAEDLTGSRIAFIHFINEDAETIELVTWSKRTLEHYCHAAYDRHYPVSRAGIWADALRQRRPVVVNDYASFPDKHGLPEGHSPLARLISAPVLENDRVVMLAGVGNKETPYNEMDVETVQLIANEIWHLVQRKRGIAALRAGEERFRSVIESSPVPFALNESDGRLTYLNKAFISTFGYTLEDIPSLEEWWPKAYPDPAYREMVRTQWSRRVAESLSDGAPFNPLEVEIQCKDGSSRTVIGMAARMEGDSRDSLLIHLYDITARKASEYRTVRLSQLYLALSECNQAIVKCRSAGELFDRVCRIIVERGGMAMAWVGMVGEISGVLEQVAAFGSGIDYLRNLKIPLSPDAPGGRGPTATSIREDRPVWCQDFMNDPMTAPWHERGAEFGWASSASIPLKKGGQPAGAITIYSEHKNAFDEDVRNLLTEMAANITFAIAGFDREEARHRAEVELLRLRAAVEQSANIIVITGTDGTIEYVNPAFQSATGYSAAEAVGKKPSILSSREQGPDFYGKLWATINEGRSWHGEFHNKRKDGSLYWESATISPVFDAGGKILHYIAVKQDITSRKELEASLLDALDRAESANRAKGEFLAVMSHELRTPLNGVLGFAELLSETALDTEQKEFVRTIRNSGSHLLQVVNDILDFSSIERKGVQFQKARVDIPETVKSACMAVRKTAEDKGLAFQFQIAPGVPQEIEGDPRRIQQILINLLGNAVKFTARGSVVLRGSLVSEDKRDFIDFSIEDTGTGINAEMIGKLFTPFTQADSTLRRNFEGTGLGLAISQRLAAAMGGRITVVSTPGTGSTFTLRIPATRFQPTAEEPVPDDRPSPAPPAFAGGVAARILVAEDDRVSGLLTRKILSSIGLDCDLVTDGQMAVDAFIPGKYPVILMDMQMPVLDGVGATIRIRAVERNSEAPHTRIIALTANVMPGDRERCLAAGMDDFLSKPVNKKALADKLSSLLPAPRAG